jgi:hypothetical protein
MICATELLLWLNVEAMDERVADLSDLIRRGFIRVTSDDDAVILLTTTASAPKPAILPAATA